MKTLRQRTFPTRSVALLGLVSGLFACSGTSDGGFAIDPSPTEPQTDDDGGAAASDGAKAATPDDPTKPPQYALVSGLAITEIAVFQGVKVDIVKSGAKVATRNAPVVANRPGLIRVYVTPQSGWSARSVTAELQLTAGATRLPKLTDTKTIGAASTDDALDSTFNFDVSAASLSVGVTYTVALTDTSGAKSPPKGNNPALYPGDGIPEAMDTASSGAKLKIVVVPVQYNANGSGRLPDVSAAQLATYRTMMLSRYPAADVEVTARAPFSWTSTISANGSGFSSVLQGIVQLRQSDNAPDDTYYFGALAPAASFSSFCNGGCVTGLSGVADDPSDAFVRASVGLGYTGTDSANTMAHEVGHAHGREHAPCGGASSPDPSFPYSTGGIGVWGYDITAKALISPTKGKDMMGYCSPEWISDYTFAALFERIATVNGAKSIAVPGGEPAQYQMLSVDGDGSLGWSGSLTLAREPAGQLRKVTYLGADGAPVLTGKGHFYHFDHLPGGFVVVPAPSSTYSKIAVEGAKAAIARAASH